MLRIILEILYVYVVLLAGESMLQHLGAEVPGATWVLGFVYIMGFFQEKFVGRS